MSRPYTKAEVLNWHEDRELERLRAEVKDLRARLKAARASWFGPSPEQGEEWDEVLRRVTDLRVRNWRKP